MADKLQQGVNVLTTFVEGETPTAAKLNSITAQLKNASQQLERAVGDIHGQSYPYSSATSARLSIAYGRANASALTGAETRSLDIVNIARLIGPASALNPMVLGNDLEITEPVPASVTEFSLRYPPESPLGVSFSKDGTGEAFETRQLVASLAAAGEFHVDALGRVYTTQETDSVDPGTVTYTINRGSWFGGPNYEDGCFNVIPDPNQLSSGGSGCSISSPPDAQGRRTITLPTATHAQFDVDMDSVSLDDADPNYQKQLILPQVLTSEYTSGETIPEGFLLLKNWTTGEVYDTAEYTYLSNSTLQIGNVDITTEVDRGDVFCIITVGTDITTAIDDLRRKSRHAHDRNFGEPLVPADSITDWTAGPWGSRGSFTTSAIEGNYAPQYLHRYGYQSGENDWNDQNVMRGHLVLGKAGAAEGEYFDSDGISYSVYFGDTDGPRFYNVSESLYVTTANGNMDFDADGSFVAEAGASMRLQADGGDIVLRTTAGDINVQGGMEFNLYAGDPYVTDSYVASVSLRMDETAGNISHVTSSSIGDSIAVGPLRDGYYTSGDHLELWAIDENGARGGGSDDGTGADHYATTTTTGSDAGNSGWKVPTFQVLHYAQWNKTFEPYDDSGGSSPQWDQVAFWMTNINLPHYLYQDFANNLGGNAVLGCSVMVKSSAVNSRWFTLGGSARYGGTHNGSEGGERVICWIDKDDTSQGGNDLHILIGGDGNSSQNFHWSRFQGGDGNNDPAQDISVDIKILLFVAAPTDSVTGIKAVRP